MFCKVRGGFSMCLGGQGLSRWCHAAVQRLVGKESRHWVNKSVTVRGWIQSSQLHKKFLFFHVNDGSSLSDLQVVVSLPNPHPSWAKNVTPGSSVLVKGTLVNSDHSGQEVELAASDVELLGQCDTNEHLFKSRRKLDAEYTRQFPHLRPRTKDFSSLLRLRDTATAAVHKYLRSKGLLQVHTPIITPCDCEGAGALFTVKPDRTDKGDDDFFGCKAYLTVSGQLYAEAMACGMSNVYTFGPTFRAEHTHTRRHLSEFHMIEPEMVLFELDSLLEVMEGLFKASVEEMFQEREEDLKLYHQESPLTEEWVMKCLSTQFERMTYTEAIDVLSKATTTSFQFKPEWGNDLQSEHEQYLTSHVGNLPLFVTDYPTNLRPFYARLNDDGRTVSCVDLLVPGIGELAGGSLREERLDILENTLIRKEMLDSYQWYLDLRRYGTMPHGGFGLGFERLLQAVLGVKQIRDVIPFPRLLGSCVP